MKQNQANRNHYHVKKDENLRTEKGLELLEKRTAWEIVNNMDNQNASPPPAPRKDKTKAIKKLKILISPSSLWNY